MKHISDYYLWYTQLLSKMMDGQDIPSHYSHILFTQKEEHCTAVDIETE
jgi:hypothetical protein